jgi:prepilin-type N-terminal cleavage/methylation domain-containing protein/prepilin-type processing-associated H-X9-DG protein
MNQKINQRGFTLIELLVVIAIIAILAAILFPVFARAREKARQTTCSSNQRQIAASVQMYAQDHEETLPDATSFWTVLALDPGVMVCPTKGKNTVNGYGFIQNLSGVSVGATTDPTTEMLTCDANFSTTTANLTNTVASSANIDNARHSGKYVASYLDGHVSQTTDSPFAVQWTGKTTYITVTPIAIGTIGGSTIGSTAAANGAGSLALIPGNVDGCVQFKASAVNVTIGLTSLTSTTTPTSANITYALKVITASAAPFLQVLESGASKTITGTNVANAGTQVYTVQRKGKVITYYQDSTLLYTSADVSSSLTGQLMVAVAFDGSATASDVNYYRYAKL